VTADHELLGRVEVQAVEQGQGGDHARGIAQSTLLCGQAEHRCRAHAARGTDQPDSDTPFTHEDVCQLSKKQYSEEGRSTFDAGRRERRGFIQRSAAQGIMARCGREAWLGATAGTTFSPGLGTFCAILAGPTAEVKRAVILGRVSISSP